MPVQSWFAALKRLLASKHALWVVPATAASLLAFGLDIGWLVDDHVHRAVLTRHPDLPELHRSPEMLFAFADGDPERIERAITSGLRPWWSAPDLRLAFWRPVAGWTHALDYRLWPENPRLMHLHSLLWFLLAVALLLLLYRRVLPHPGVAGLAGLIYAIDDCQAMPALWLANRNSVLALVFGVACLIAHDRWRRSAWRPGAVAGPVLLLAAVLANEGAVAIGGYLVSHALFLDPAPWRHRVAALLPCAGIGLAWAIAYKIGGFGAFGSGVYIDSATEPLRFAAAAAERAPTLLWGWWGFPPADLSSLLPDPARRTFVLIVAALLGLLAWALRPVLRREPAARFLGLGMLLALLPACSTFPSNRLLGFVGIGAAGLLALLLAELASAARAAAGFHRWGRWSLLGGLAGVHLVLAPLFVRPYVSQMQQFDGTIQRAATSLVELTNDEAEGTQVIVVATPSAFLSLGSTITAAVVHDWRPLPSLVLSSTIYDTVVTRPDDVTLIVRPQGGFLRSPGAPDPANLEVTRPGLDPLRALLLVDHLFRDLRRAPLRAGDRLELDGVTLEILEDESGRPLSVAFRFAEPLESPRWRWLAWRNGRYARFPLPASGEAVTWRFRQP